MDEDILDWIDQIDDMLLDPDYEFAEETLSGIKDWVTTNDLISDAQKQAILNIQDSRW